MSGLTRALVARAARVTCAGRRLAPRRFADAYSIAMYHGLSDDLLEVSEPCIIDRRSFLLQMEHFAANFTVVHVDDAAHVASTQPSKPVACITFDDGFASVHDLAWPILESLALPATVYLVTGLVDSPDTVWFADLHDAITRTRVPSITLDGLTHPLGTAAEKALASAALQRSLKMRDADEFDRCLQHLLAELAAPARRLPSDRPPPDPDHRRDPGDGGRRSHPVRRPHRAPPDPHSAAGVASPGARSSRRCDGQPTCAGALRRRSPIRTVVPKTSTRLRWRRFGDSGSDKP